MSLTAQLRGGELAAWCASRLPGTAVLAAEISAAARQRKPVRPASGRVAPRWWAEIGGAFGARLAAVVEPSPPYYALYGLASAGVVSRAWADAQAGEWPTHSGLRPRELRRALELRPSPTGWRDLGGPTGTRVARGPAEPVLGEWFARARRYLAEHAPPGQLGTSGAEAGLARVFWLVSAFEDAYRSGDPGPVVELFGVSSSVDTLHGVAPAAAVAELVELAQLLRESGSLDRLRALAGDSGPGLGWAGPVFAHHWADGDLVVGDTLLDVKTVIRTDDVERASRWLWQLLGYAWLDVHDRWRIRAVGLYLARHGLVLTWPADEFAARLLGGRGANQLQARDEFLAVATRVLTAEGSQLLA
ncbi:hypothetical protein LV79_003556 [Actinokineospora globicatena]|nr:hypothetical protein [Actinokineospora globicatena]